MLYYYANTHGKQNRFPRALLCYNVMRFVELSSPVADAVRGTLREGRNADRISSPKYYDASLSLTLMDQVRQTALTPG
jgi:hypothetical protein